MKLENYQLDDLHQIALNECEGHPELIDRANKLYREHVDDLAALIRRAREEKSA